MDFALAFFALAPGLAFGSFLNVVAARVPLKRSIVSPGSSCMSCGHELTWYENVPVLSYVALRGRCRGCQTSIGLVYPAVEILTGLLVAASFLAFGWSGKSFVAALFCMALVTISATDISHRIVPNVIVLPAAAFVLVAMTALDPSAQWALGAFGASFFLFLAALAHPRGMGMGDVKLALLLGAMVGRNVPVALMVGMLAALVPSIVLFARHGSAARKMAIPFAPFLAFGGLVALFFGDRLLDAYLTLL
ncbi:MAG TPA: prepilin peptidase [Gaiellaceae bacterium]|nr:prepilin peptidase [Gaiellaceae bacterium]